MDKNHEVFDDYVMKFDLNDYGIKYKYNHSYRVMDECKKLAETLDFDDDGVMLSMVIGLFHDIGRFKQLESANTFNDLNSFDHGKEACDILFEEGLIDELEVPENSEEVISKAIYNHNKRYYEDEDYDEVDKVFCNIVRDADKLDILRTFDVLPGDTKCDDSLISQKVREDFFNHKLIERKNIKSNNDNVLVILAFVFDINFEYTKDKIISEKLIDKIYKSIDKNIFKEY